MVKILDRPEYDKIPSEKKELILEEVRKLVLESIKKLVKDGLRDHCDKLGEIYRPKWDRFFYTVWEPY